MGEIYLLQVRGEEKLMVQDPWLQRERKKVLIQPLILIQAAR